MRLGPQEVTVERWWTLKWKELNGRSLGHCSHAFKIYYGTLSSSPSTLLLPTDEVNGFALIRVLTMMYRLKTWGQ